MELPTPTVHRIVHALVEEQLLLIDVTGRIMIGSEIAVLAQASSAGLVTQIHPLLVRLGQETEEPWTCRSWRAR